MMKVTRPATATVRQLEQQLQAVVAQQASVGLELGHSSTKFVDLQQQKVALEVALSAARQSEQAHATARAAHGFQLGNTVDRPRLPHGVHAQAIDRPGPHALEQMTDYRPALKEAYPGKGEIETARGLTSYLSRRDIDWQVLRYVGPDGATVAGVHLNVFTTADGRKVAAFEQGWVKKGTSEADALAIFRVAMAQAKKAGATSLIVELNDPKVWSGADARRTPWRADNEAFMGKLGFQRVEGQYAQPSLDPHEKPVEGLHLGYLQLDDKHHHSVSSKQIAASVLGYYGSFEVFHEQGGAAVAEQAKAYRDFVGSLHGERAQLHPL